MVSDTETAVASAPAPAAPAAPKRSWWPALVLGSLMGTAFVVYATLSTFVDVPRVHPDEVRYLIGASSLVEGEGLTLRGQAYGFGPLHAAVLALILLASSGVDQAYDFFKAANALFFALTAVPVYLLARRLVTPWWAVCAAGLSIAIPSSISIATVMTESLGYLTAAWAMYAVVLALERTTPLRQLAMLAAVAVAFLVRSQYGAIYIAWLIALCLVWLVSPERRPRTRQSVVGLWPSILPLALAAAVLIGKTLAGSSPSASLGAYWELWRGYDPFQVAKWFVYHLADFEIYLAVIPLAVTPIVLSRLIRGGRAGSTHMTAFAALFVSANVVGLLVVAAFNSTPFGYDRLHDRYAFYLVPLWLIVFVVWLADGLPRPRTALITGVALALLLPAVLPFRQLANEVGIDTVPGALWLRIEAEVAGPGPVSGQRLLGLFVIVLLAATVLVPRRLKIALPLAVLVVFAATSVLAWDRMLAAPEDEVFAGGLEREWIDQRLPSDAVVAKLYIESPRCPTSSLTRHALFATEFFNMTVDRAYFIGDSVPDGIPIVRVDVASNGLLELESGEPLRADYVYTQPGIDLAGQRIAEGTAAHLVLWKIGGPVKIIGAASDDDVTTADCT